MNINDLSSLVHSEAEKKGFWDYPREFGTIIALCHSELSEALQADRKQQGEEQVQEELCDALMRILDYLGSRNADIETIILNKIEANKKRPYRNGVTY